MSVMVGFVSASARVKVGHPSAVPGLVTVTVPVDAVVPQLSPPPELQSSPPPVDQSSPPDTPGACTGPNKRVSRPAPATYQNRRGSAWNRVSWKSNSVPLLA